MNGLKAQIKSVITNFASGNLLGNSKSLLNILGYESDRTLQISPNNYEGFAEQFIQDISTFDPKKAKKDDWQSIDIIFQLTQDDIRKTQSLFDAKQVDNKIIESYLFFAISLKGDRYTRSDLVRITREINKLTPMPSMLLFRYNDYLTISVIDRRLHKREASKDVLEKVTLIKDINIKKPHRAHIEILFDLALENLISKYSVSNFIELHNAWRKTLDTSELNKRFYSELANWYFWALDNVEFPKGGGLDEKVRNAEAVIRLLTRLIFIWFIKEKRLVPDDLFTETRVRNLLKDLEPDNSTYYKAILQNLFFATLNTDPKETPRRWRGKNKGNGQDSHYLIPNVYRYKEEFHTPDEAFTLFKDIPFLNGGLFECLDKEIKDEDLKNMPELTNLVLQEGKGRILRIDGFSERKENPLCFPNKLFFSDERTEDLNDIYGTKNKTYKVRGLINTLERYKFTVDENTPVEEEIALDPELLGKVFENLLASYTPETGTTARKQTGSFYTPREIVNYMVDESLIAYLLSKLPSPLEGEGEGEGDGRHSREGGNPEAEQKLRHLLSYTDEPHQFTPSEVDALIDATDNIKIIDPACGSGAFPMGILHKLVYILDKLDHDNKKWKQKQIDKVMEISDSTVREKLVEDIEESFHSNELDYGRKLYLIENCIFGVDIQPIAVQIAKLRFFISLIVDQKADPAKENIGIRPLPNLETKFVAANAIIGIEKPKELHLSMNITEIDCKEAELKMVRERHFTARTLKTKRECREKDERLRAEISELLKKDGFPSNVTEKLTRWNPYDQNASSDFFDPEWMFGISAYSPLNKGGEGGFDVVIANPPYVKEYTNRKAFDGLRNSPYYQGKMDIWYLFACKGIDLLKNDTGILTFIAQNNWVTSYGASKMRNKVIKDTRIINLVDFCDYKIFESADIQTMIMIFQRDSKSDNYYFDYRRFTEKEVSFEDMLNLLHKEIATKNEFLKPVIQRKNFLDKTLTFSHSENENILNKIFEQSNFKLTENEVAQGIVFPQDFVNKESQKILGDKFNVGDGIFVLSEKEKDSIPFTKEELELVKPSYTTKELCRYDADKHNSEWVIYTDSRFKYPKNIKPYPNIKAHLDKFKKVITSDNKPYGLHRARDEKFFKGEKIIAVRKCNEPTFTYTDFDCYVSATFYVIKSERINLKYLTALLNSKLIAFWLRHKGKMQGNNYQIDKEPLLAIPIYNPSNKDQQPFITLVDQILSAKKKDPNADTSALEKQIDEMVYKLYGLTPDEIEIVEGEKD